MNFKLLALIYLLASNLAFSQTDENTSPANKSTHKPSSHKHTATKATLSNAKPPSKTTMDFFNAVLAGNFEIAELLLKQGADINCGNCNDFGATPLMAGTQNLVNANLPMDTVIWLVNHRADIDKQDKQGNTPLMQAARFATFVYADGNSALNYLLKNGANPGIRNHEGLNTLHFLAKSAPVPIGAGGYYLEATKNFNANYEIAVRNVIAAGAKINEATNDGITPLLIASEKCNPDVIKLFLSLGADATAKTNKGETPFSLALSMAASNRLKACNEVVEILKVNGNHQ